MFLQTILIVFTNSLNVQGQVSGEGGWHAQETGDQDGRTWRPVSRWKSGSKER